MPSDAASPQSQGVDLLALAGDDVLAGKADVSAARENTRQRRVRKLAVTAIFVGLLYIGHHYGVVATPHLTSTVVRSLLIVGLLLGLGLVLLAPVVFGGRSPHTTYRASDIDVRIGDVKGLGSVTTEVVNTVNLFLGFKTFARDMGGTPRRGILFEGPPGTGKTFMAKAMAGEAGVPFLFVNSSAFQSMYHGQTNRKIRAYFGALRKAARQEGGAIGFIEELDAIGAARTGMGGSGESIAGVVNELLIQLQSFDTPTKGDRIKGAVVDAVNRWLPERRQISKAAPATANILVIGATNRAADLDPALVRPGRFDRTISFDPPSRVGRAEILEYYLAKKAHDGTVGTAESVSRLAAMTMGYTPVMLEHLLDEALVIALRRGARQMTWADISDAKLVTELGLTQPAAYTEAERRTIATHEAGHATIAYFVGQSRKLDVLSIKKRKAALGLLQHSDAEERFTTTRSEFVSLLQIAMGGLCAEEQFFGEAGSGPSGDLAAATEMAAAMIGAYGMGDVLLSLQPVVKATGGSIVSQVLSSEEGRRAVEALLCEARAAAASLLHQHADVVEALRDALLDRDELLGDEIAAVVHSTLEASVLHRMIA